MWDLCGTALLVGFEMDPTWNNMICLVVITNDGVEAISMLVSTCVYCDNGLRPPSEFSDVVAIFWGCGARHFSIFAGTHGLVVWPKKTKKQVEDGKCV